MEDDDTRAGGAPLAWEGPAVGLLDLDAFFASVEQLDHPAWRGRPVIVGSPEGRGVVATASYEARSYGVHSAMPSSQALRLCPQAIWARPRHERYRELSDAVMELLVRETPLVEQVSVDEAFFDVTPGTWSNEDPVEICRRAQREVRSLGLSCSIGLSTGKTVAKVASERDKPRGLTVVPPGTERAFLAPLPVSALSGVGEATRARLAAMGIRTLGQLAAARPDDLAAQLGVVGPRLVARAQGMPDSPVRPAAQEREAKSVSHERTFARDLTRADDLRAAVLSQAAQVGRRLRAKGLQGTTVTLKLRRSDLSVHTAQCQLPRPTDDEAVFGPVAAGLLEAAWRPGQAVRLVGVGMSGFDGAHAFQPSLLAQDGGGDEGARPTLARATDAIRERFGEGAVGFGREWRLRDAAGPGSAGSGDRVEA